MKVLELCHFTSGPYCAKLLADLGAQVIKIEEPSIGDPSRRRGAFLDDIPNPEKSGPFLYLNTNKLGITLNLKVATGRKLFFELLKQTDVLVEDNPPKTMKELGLDYQSLYPINPQLIMTSITPFGQTGPHKNYKAYHLNTFHAGGGAYVLSALSNQPPVKGGGGLGDYDSAISAAVATTAALYSRWTTGEGQHVDISKQESSIALDRIENVAYANRDDAETRAHALARGPLGGLFPCSDGYIVISLLEDKQWQALTRLMGNPEWTEKYSDRDSINRHRDEIMVLISQWTKGHTKQEIYHKAQALGCPAGPVNNAKNLIDSNQLKARGFFVEITHSEAGTLKYPSAPYRFSKTPWAVERPAPLLGQHNKEIFGQLGYSDSELVKLREAGVI